MSFLISEYRLYLLIKYESKEAVTLFKSRYFQKQIVVVLVNYILTKEVIFVVRYRIEVIFLTADLPSFDLIILQFILYILHKKFMYPLLTVFETTNFGENISYIFLTIFLHFHDIRMNSFSEALTQMCGLIWESFH